MTAYYNEIDPYCAAWLQNLMDAGHIAPGVIDTRSIEDVRPDELAGYTQCHFFAGIGVWSLALRAAGWPDSRPAWTGSCPCQPFSAAGKGAGFADERHLWPAWQHLIAQCRPPVIFGEQVASKAVDAWIDLVHADMEGLGYAFGCVPFPSAGVGAPHIRDRTFWVADSGFVRPEMALQHERGSTAPSGVWQTGFAGVCGAPVGLGYANGAGLEGHAGNGGAAGWQGSQRPVAEAGVSVWLADANGRDASAEREQCSGKQRQQPEDGGAMRLAKPDGQCARIDPEALHAGQSKPCGGGGDGRPGPTNGQWADADWLGCTDGKWRPVEPGTFPLAHGATRRVGRLRAYGNAISAPAATAFIQSYIEARA